MTTETTLAGVYEARANRLMREAGDCSSATVVAVTEMGRTLDFVMAQLVALEERLSRQERQPQPPIAREQMRMEVTL